MKRLLLLCLLGAFMYGNAFAQDEDHPWAIGLDFGVMEYAGDHGFHMYKISSGYAVGLSVFKYMNPSFDIGFHGYYDGVFKSDPDNLFPGQGFNFFADVLFMKAEAKYKFNNGYILKRDARIQPYLTAGIGGFYSRTTGTGIWGAVTSHSSFGPDVSFGPGISVPITKSVALEVFSILNFPFNTDYIDLVSNENPAFPLKNNLGDFFIQNSLSVKITLNQKTKDSDNDGVSDKKDQCPDTPAGVAVDENGCPLDSDLDGVPDYLDECPTTPGLEKFKGCPDTDGDGIPDKDDACPDVAGLISLKGCPDSDGDGVSDKDDRCPDTPAGWEVDKFGCPIDRDRDGIPDSEDDCPDKPGVAELKGCPWTPPALMVKYGLNNKNILFDFDSSKLQNEGTNTLNIIAKALKNHDDFGVLFEGFTDWTGTDDYNLKLSEKRVVSAKNYLMGKGIGENRISTSFFGEAKPVKENSTKEGRKYNRRVEFNFFNLK